MESSSPVQRGRGELEFTLPSPTAAPAYDDDVVKLFLGATVLWAIVGMLVGVYIALELAYWPANLGVQYTTFGRLRPLHTNAVIFAFGGNICFTGIYYSMQRLLKTPMWSRARYGACAPRGRAAGAASSSTWTCAPMPASFPTPGCRSSTTWARRRFTICK